MRGERSIVGASFFRPSGFSTYYPSYGDAGGSGATGAQSIGAVSTIKVGSYWGPDNWIYDYRSSGLSILYNPKTKLWVSQVITDPTVKAKVIAELATKGRLLGNTSSGSTEIREMQEGRHPGFAKKVAAVVATTAPKAVLADLPAVDEGLTSKSWFLPASVAVGALSVGGLIWYFTRGK